MSSNLVQGIHEGQNLQKEGTDHVPNSYSFSAFMDLVIWSSTIQK